MKPLPLLLSISLLALLASHALAQDFENPFMETPDAGSFPTNAVIRYPRPLPPSPTAALTPEGGTPGPSTHFDGWTGRSLPPDTMGAAGPNHVVTMLNTGVHIHNRSGSVEYISQSLSNWWLNAGAGTNVHVFDPKVVYDASADRWIATVCTEAFKTNSHVLFAFSSTGNPTNSWYIHKVRADPNGVYWADFPHVGFNKNWIAVDIHMFATTNGSARTFSRMYCFDRTNVYAGGSTRTTFDIVDTTLTNIFHIVPAVTLDTNLETLYCLQRWTSSTNFTNVVNGVTTVDVRGALRLHSITGTPSSPVLVHSQYFPAAASAWNSRPSALNFAPQKDTSTKIAVNDDRLGNVIYRNGYLWTVQTVFLPATNPTRSAIQWWQIDPKNKGEPIQVSIFQNDTNFFGFPSIAVNRFDDVLIGFSVFATNIFASAGYAFRQMWDPPNTLRSPHVVYKAGLDPYIYVDENSGRNRWGDYSATVVDPLNDADFWTLQEYAYTSETNGVPSRKSATHWAQVVVTVPANDNFANAIQISGASGSTNGSMYRGTAQPEESYHVGAAPYRSIWYRWTAPATGSANFDTIGSPNTIDTRLAVYVGTSVSSNSLTLIAANDDGFDRFGKVLPMSKLTFTATNALTYYLAIDGKRPIEISDAIILSWHQPAAPVFFTEPTNTHVLAGDGIILTSLAVANPAAVYLWRFNSNVLTGATFARYTNTVVQLTNEGFYDVIASNSIGSITSAAAYVKVYASATASFTNQQLINQERIQVLVDGIDGYNYTVQGTTDFITWTNLQTGVCDFVFTNYFTTNFPMRFFRTYY